MSFKQAGMTLLCVLLICTGQILFKLGSSKLSLAGGLIESARSFLNPWIISALFLYAGTTILWILVLSFTPLSLAYPLNSLAFIIVPLLGSFFLNEAFTMKTLIGGLVIIIGVCISTI